MQQENQHGEQRDEPAAEQPIGEQPREESAREKEQVGDQVAGKVNVGGVFKPQNALGDD